MNKLKIVNGEICYLSDATDQTYGMWCPVSYETPHDFKECEYLVPESEYKSFEPFKKKIERLEKKIQFISEDNDYLEDCVEDLNEQIRIKDAVMKNIERQLMLSTDQNDLLLDEFTRVKLLTDNEEIHGLCERAHVRMRQNVSVIDRNIKLNEQVSKLKYDIVSLINIAQDSLNMAGKTSHAGTIYVGADPNFAKESLQRSLDNFKSIYKDKD